MRSSWSVESVAAVLRQLVRVAPIAWRGDPVFRWALIGAAISLGLLVSRPAELAGQSAVLPPAPLSSSAPAPAPTRPASQPALQPVNKLAPAFGPNVPLETLPAPTRTPATTPAPAGPAFGTLNK
jgi:hypothetical protein